jgi:DNA-binding NarL/FixJ family response regulator
MGPMTSRRCQRRCRDLFSKCQFKRFFYVNLSFNYFRKKTMEYAVLIEDHPMMAEAIGSSLWRWLPGLQLLRAYSLEEAQALLRDAKTPVAFIITDLQLPGSSPEHTLQAVRQWQPQTPVLALTMLADVATMRLCAQNQAMYLCKSAAAESLRQTLKDWLGDDNWQRWSAQPAPQHHPMQDLTTRQLGILHELANGRSNREIADLLHISEDTVRSHIKALFARLGVKNRTQASKFYLQHKQSAAALRA